jgi:hypothetical protein
MAEVREIKEQLRKLAEDVLAGDVGRGDAVVVNQIHNTILNAIRTELKITEQLELVRRLEQMEEVLSRRNGPERYHHYGR